MPTRYEKLVTRCEVCPSTLHINTNYTFFCIDNIHYPILLYPILLYKKISFGFFIFVCVMAFICSIFYNRLHAYTHREGHGRTLQHRHVCGNHGTHIYIPYHTRIQMFGFGGIDRENGGVR
jgi:hypothetical protein